MEQEEAGQPLARRLVGIDLGITSRHSVRVLEADGQVVCRSSCVPTVESLARLEQAALAGAPEGTRLAVVFEPTGPALDQARDPSEVRCSASQLSVKLRRTSTDNWWTHGGVKDRPRHLASANASATSGLQHARLIMASTLSTSHVREILVWGIRSPIGGWRTMVMQVPDHKLTLAAVLGSSNATRLPRAYVDRRTVEKAFAEGLATQTHIVVFGTPGVGKSALVRRNVDGSALIFVECLRGQRAPDVYRSILSEVGARIKTETRLSKKKRLSATLKFFGADAERGTENTETEITIDLGNVGDVLRILQSRGDRRHFVLLNNFHLLARGAQRRIVGDLQYVFERTGIRVIIVGNWTSPAYLADLNSFLPSFVTDVHVTTWSDDDLVIVLHKIEELLNVSFEADIADELIARSVGSVRELTDNCRLLLTAAGVESAQKSTKVIDNIEQLHEIVKQKMGRLVSRYAEMLSSYLTADLFTTEGVDVGKFLVRVVSDLITDGDGRDSDNRAKFSYDELNRALIDVVQALNEPPLAEQSRRQKLIEELATAIRRRGTNDVAVSLRSVVDSQRPDITEEQYALQRSVKRLMRTQAKHGFHPPLLAYDPHARSLIAIDPKFRVFLRIDSGEIKTLQHTDLTPVDQERSYGWRTTWAATIKETAVTHRWLAQHSQQTE